MSSYVDPLTHTDIVVCCSMVLTHNRCQWLMSNSFKKYLQNPHHQVVLISRKSLSLSPPSLSLSLFLSSIVPWMSTRQHSVSAQRSSLVSPSLLPLLSQAYFRLTFEMGGGFSYSNCFMDFCFLDLFKCLVLFCSSHRPFFFERFVCVKVVHPYSSTDRATVWKKSRFIFS